MPETANIKELPGMIQSSNKCPIKVAQRVMHFLTSDVPGVTSAHKRDLAALLGRNNTYRLRLAALLQVNPEQHQILIEELVGNIDSSFPLIQFFHKKGFISKPSTR